MSLSFTSLVAPLLRSPSRFVVPLCGLPVRAQNVHTSALQNFKERKEACRLSFSTNEFMSTTWVSSELKLDDSVKLDELDKKIYKGECSFDGEEITIKLRIDKKASKEWQKEIEEREQFYKNIPKEIGHSF